MDIQKTISTLKNIIRYCSNALLVIESANDEILSGIEDRYDIAVASALKYTRYMQKHDIFSSAEEYNAVIETLLYIRKMTPYVPFTLNDRLFMYTQTELLSNILSKILLRIEEHVGHHSYRKIVYSSDPDIGIFGETDHIADIINALEDAGYTNIEEVWSEVPSRTNLYFTDKNGDRRSVIAVYIP